LPANNLAPYISVNNSAWQKTKNYTTDSALCLINYPVPKNSIVGLFAQSSNIIGNIPQLTPIQTAKNTSSTIPKSNSSTSITALLTPLSLSALYPPIKSINRTQAATIIMVLVVLGIIFYMSRVDKDATDMRIKKTVQDAGNTNKKSGLGNDRKNINKNTKVRK